MSISIGDAILKIGLDKKDLDASMSTMEANIKSSMQKMQNQLRIGGAAMTAFGAAGLKAVSDARQLNAQLGQTGLTIGVSTKEMREMALAITNVTFPLESVTKTFDLLAQAGIKDTEIMKASANAFDALADATGSNAEIMADLLLPAFKLFGEEIPTTSAELDKFTWLTKNSLVDLSDFGTLLTRMAPYMDELNLSMDDAIVMLKGLSEKGIQGTAATLALRTAITQAASSGESLTDILGLTEDELEKYRSEMESATGITDEYAAVANEQFGIMDKIKQKFEELTLVAGSFLTPLEPILATMTALGPVLIFLGTAAGIAAVKWTLSTSAMIAHKIALVASTVAIKLATAAQWLWNAAMTANPIGIIIVAVAALVAGVIALWKNWDKVVSFFKGEAKSAITGLDIALQHLTDSVRENYDSIISEAESATQAMINSATSVAEAEKRALDDRAAYYRNFQLTRLDQITELMLAEIAAVNPAVAAKLEGFREELEGIEQRRKEREEEKYEEQRRALEKQLRDDDLSKKDRKRIEDDLQALEDAHREEEILEEGTQSVKDLNMETYFEEQKTLRDQELADQIQRYKDDLAALEQCDIDKIEEIKRFIALKNQIMAGAGIESEYPYEVPTEGTLYPPTEEEARLRGYQHGGLITEPTLLYGLNSLKPYAIAGEAGREAVVPVSPQASPVQTTTVSNHFEGPWFIREEADIHKVARELYRLQTLRGRY